MGFENLSGQTFGQYELREMLGVGGMGAVYRAYHSSLDREVAIKVLPRALALESGYIERFIREARTAGLLEHPHIVRIYDYGTQGEISYLVMALLRGGSLSQRLSQRETTQQKRASLGEVALMLNQIGSALDYAHHEGVLHRDIKPANIMFDTQGRAYITDFGIAKLMGATTALTGTGVAMGSPSYMPPEQWAGQELTPAADQYALGVTIYQTVAGRLPFEADSAAQLMYKHFHEEPAPMELSRTDVPGGVMVVLNRALSKSPDQRFPNISQFAQAFEGAIEGSSGESTNFFLYKVKSERPISATGTPSRPPMPYTPSGVTPPVTPGSGQQAGGQYTPPPTAQFAGGASPSGGYSMAYSPPPARPWYLSPTALIGGVVAVIGIVIISLVAILSENDNGADAVFQTLTAVAQGQTSVAVLTVNTETPTEEATQLLTVISSDTPQPTDTDTPASNTPEAAPTETVQPSITPTPTASETPTETPEPTATDTTVFTATYTFTPRPSATPTETASPTPEAPTNIALSIGETATGDINDSQPELRYEFSGTAGETISLRAETTEGTLDPSLILYGPDGAIVASNDDISASDPNAYIEAFELPEDGVYTAVVQRFRGVRGSSQGTFALTVDTFAAPENPLLVDMPITGTMNNDTPLHEYSITAESGDVLTIALFAISGDLDTVLTLYAPDGSLAATNDDYQGMSNSSIIENYSVPESGVYRLVASRFRGEAGSTSGDFTLTLTNASSAEDLLAIAVPIRSGDEILGTISDAHHTYVYSYSGTTGEILTIMLSANSGDLDTVLQFYGPDEANLIAENDNLATDGSSGDSGMSVLLVADGTYFIRATRLGGETGASSGTFSMTVESQSMQGTATPTTAACSQIAVGCVVYISSSMQREVIVRSNASASAPSVATLQANDGVTIIGGPQSAGGFTWWQIDINNSIQGWIIARIGFNDVLTTERP